MRHYPVRVISLLGLGVGLFACTESGSIPVSPSLRDASPSAAARPSATSCVANPTAVATDEASLRAALAAAQPGDVVAVSGTVFVALDLEIWNPGVTLTCAQAGDGLVSGPDVYDLVTIYAPDVTVQGLAIDATNAMDGAVFTFTFPGYDGSNAHIVGNDVRCGMSLCMFIIAPGNVISDNTMVSEHFGASGIHVQSPELPPVTGIRVERNHVTSLVPQGAPHFGGIRMVRAEDGVIRDNVVEGQWSNSIALAQLTGGLVERNTLSGATQNGIHMAYSTAAILSRGALVRLNTASSAGPALLVNQSCGNVFLANRLSSSAGVNAAFGSQSGDNILRGENGPVTDDGAYDCDGDGTNDPNIVSGHHVSGSSPGETMGPVMRHNSGLIVE